MKWIPLHHNEYQDHKIKQDHQFRQEMRNRMQTLESQIQEISLNIKQLLQTSK
jgi:hypothetical protein